MTLVGLDFLFPNGTTVRVALNATQAVITTVRQGSSGVYTGSGAKWDGTPDLSYYKVSINSPENGVVGTFDLKSVAPAQ